MASKTGRSDAPPPRSAADALVAAAARRGSPASCRRAAGSAPRRAPSRASSRSTTRRCRGAEASSPSSASTSPSRPPSSTASRSSTRPPRPATASPTRWTTRRFCGALVDQIVAGGVLAGRRGRFRFTSTSALPDMLPPAPRQVARIKAEQSNTSVVFGGRAMLKIYRKLEAGPNPEAEITDFLTRHTEFRAAPRLGGAIAVRGRAARSRSSSPRSTSSSPTRATRGRRFQARLGEYFAVAVTGPEAGGRPDPAFARALAGADAREARGLGELTGALHMALATATPPALAARAHRGRRRRGVARGHGGRDRPRPGRRSAASLDALPADVRDLARRAIEAMPQAKAALAGLDALTAEPVRKIRVHGDYHLGQVLRTEGGARHRRLRGRAGAAARRAPREGVRAPRRRRHDALVRLRRAGRHAAGRRGRPATAPASPSAWTAWAREWEDGVRAAFMEGYLGETLERGATFLPRRRDALDAALRVFELGKLVYEIGYEVNHRPSWARIPLEALLEVVAPAPREAPALLRLARGAVLLRGLPRAQGVRGLARRGRAPARRPHRAGAARLDLLPHPRLLPAPQVPRRHLPERLRHVGGRAPA